MPCLLFDVEGTITSLSFVQEQLSPYSRQAMSRFIEREATTQKVAPIIDRLAAQIGCKAVELERIGQTLVRWIDQDRKAGDLKLLQGMIWEEGYRCGAFRGHLYADVLPFWKAARQQGVRLAIYSSGSVQAQRLLLQYSDSGDVSPYISRHFDTGVGPKAKPDSYRKIALGLSAPPADISFYSDSLAELDAARAAGMNTCRLRRPGVPPAVHAHREIEGFAQESPTLETAL